jgi:hypothetical protein
MGCSRSWQRKLYGGCGFYYKSEYNALPALRASAWHFHVGAFGLRARFFAVCLENARTQRPATRHQVLVHQSLANVLPPNIGFASLSLQGSDKCFGDWFGGLVRRPWGA